MLKKKKKKKRRGETVSKLNELLFPEWCPALSVCPSVGTGRGHGWEGWGHLQTHMWGEKWAAEGAALLPWGAGSCCRFQREH